MWIFGYGSLIWRPGFEWLERRPGYVLGWKRRFWQGSTDHRGVPEAPGRVVTLLREVGARTWGAAYRVDHAEWGRIVARLDHREKGGYEQYNVQVHTPDHAAGVIDRALVYVATPDNPDYLGEADPTTIMRQILGSEGPSGANLDYFRRLDQSMRELGVDDAHLKALDRARRDLASSLGAPDAHR